MKTEESFLLGHNWQSGDVLEDANWLARMMDTLVFTNMNDVYQIHHAEKSALKRVYKSQYCRLIMSYREKIFPFNWMSLS